MTAKGRKGGEDGVCGCVGEKNRNQREKKQRMETEYKGFEYKGRKKNRGHRMEER